MRDPEPLRARLFRLLALAETAPEPPVADVLSERAVPGGVRMQLALGGRPATYLAPAADGPCPAVLYCHAQGGDATGRAELTEGAEFLATPWGPELLRHGFAVLCLGHARPWRPPAEGREAALAKAGLWQGRPLLGQMLGDLRLGLSWLAAQAGVDAGRIAALGMSMGAAHAFWLGAMDRRIGAVVQMCMLADIGPLIASGSHDRHGDYLTLPGLLRLAGMGDVAGLVAPRPQFVAHGADDPLTPPEAHGPALDRLRAAYRVFADDLHECLAPDTAHRETPAMRRAEMGFLLGWAAARHPETKGHRHA